jgi:hypothetical protein
MIVTVAVTVTIATAITIMIMIMIMRHPHFAHLMLRETAARNVRSHSRHIAATRSRGMRGGASHIAASHIAATRVSTRVAAHRGGRRCEADPESGCAEKSNSCCPEHENPPRNVSGRFAQLH